MNILTHQRNGNPHLQTAPIPGAAAQEKHPPQQQQPHTACPHLKSSSLMSSPPHLRSRSCASSLPPPGKRATSAGNSPQLRSHSQLRSSCFFHHLRSSHRLRSHCNLRRRPCTTQHLDLSWKAKLGRQRNPQKKEKVASPEK